MLVARHTGQRLMLVGMPALAGLSILHGLVPPHPGPEVAIASLHADQGRTLIFGLIVAVPTLIICGPLLARVLDRLVPIGCGSLFFSHVNDAGFRLVKEYFGMTVGQTIRSWSLMETAVSVVGFAFVMLLNLVT